jgi:hypothetical protein
MPVVSGESLLVQQGESGATVTMGNQTVRILRSDIVLENGVMHVSGRHLVESAALTPDYRKYIGRSRGLGDDNESCLTQQDE